MKPHHLRLLRALAEGPLKVEEDKILSTLQTLARWGLVGRTWTITEAGRIVLQQVDLVEAGRKGNLTVKGGSVNDGRE